MNYLHYEFNLNTNDIVVVTLDKQAYVRLLDDLNYSKYHHGKKHTYYGRLEKKSPVHLSPPHSGHWHLVIDLGGRTGTINVSVRKIKG